MQRRQFAKKIQIYITKFVQSLFKNSKSFLPLQNGLLRKRLIISGALLFRLRFLISGKEKRGKEIGDWFVALAKTAVVLIFSSVSFRLTGRTGLVTCTFRGEIIPVP